MQIFKGRLTEIWLENGLLAGQIDCNLVAGLSPGQYLVAQPVEGPVEALPAILFPNQITPTGFKAAPPIPAGWKPGTDLLIRGPQGKGFCLPDGIRRVGLLALDFPGRLLPLARQALLAGLEVALLCQANTIDLASQDIPSALEVNPLSSLPALLAWADYLALDLAAEHLPQIGQQLGIRPGDRLPIPAQALVMVSMPCAAAAECGVCAVKGRHGYRLVCKDGPVFDLNDLEW